MKEHIFRAQNYPVRFNLRRIAECFSTKPLSESPLELVYKYGEFSYVFLFNFGTIVFVNIATEEQTKIFKTISSVAKEPNIKMSEDFMVEVDSHLSGNYHEMGFSKMKVRDLTYPILRLVAMVVGESAALDYFEDATEALLQKSYKIALDLENGGKIRLSMKNMVKFIGEVLTTKQEIIADLYVVDAPDETWDDQTLDRLYDDAKRLFEVETRYRVLEFKLKLVQETVDVIVELLKFRQETLLEIIVIALIAVEVFWLFKGMVTH